MLPRKCRAVRFGQTCLKYYAVVRPSGLRARSVPKPGSDDEGGAAQLGGANRNWAYPLEPRSAGFFFAGGGEELGEALGEGGGVFERAAFGEHGLVVDEVHPFLDALGAGGGLFETLQVLEQRVLEVELEDALGLGQLAALSAQHALDLRR